VQLHEAAKTDVAFFLNSTVAAIGVGATLVADEIAHESGGLTRVWVYAVPFALAYLVYRFAIGAAVRQGVEMRASIDLHRLEVYERLGVRRPKSFQDEHEIAHRLNRFFLYATPLRDGLWAPKDEKPSSEDAPEFSFRRIWAFGVGSQASHGEEVSE
jgi:hypothetical protein